MFLKYCFLFIFIFEPTFCVTNAEASISTSTPITMTVAAPATAVTMAVSTPVAPVISATASPTPILTTTPVIAAAPGPTITPIFIAPPIFSPTITTPVINTTPPITVTPSNFLPNTLVSSAPTLQPINPVITPTTLPPIIVPSPIPTITPSATPPSIPILQPINPSIMKFQQQSTTIQPLAEAYRLANDNNSPTTQLQKIDTYLQDKHQKEYHNLIQESLALAKEKENVLIQLHAQLELQLETQKFATQQRERAIEETQKRLIEEEEKSKKEAEDMRLNVKSLVDLSPLILNVNQSRTKNNNDVFDFNNLQNAQNGAENCKNAEDENDCLLVSSHCKWGRLTKKKKKKCLFMCEKLSHDNCKKISNCILKNNTCKNK